METAGKPGSLVLCPLPQQFPKDRNLPPEIQVRINHPGRQVYCPHLAGEELVTQRQSDLSRGHLKTQC